MRDIQIKVPQLLAASVKAMGLEWWYEPAGAATWCSCCERKDLPTVHVGSTRDGHNVGLCGECVNMLSRVFDGGPLRSNKDQPLTAAHVDGGYVESGTRPTSNRVEEPKPSAPARKKRSELKKARGE